MHVPDNADRMYVTNLVICIVLLIGRLVAAYPSLQNFVLSHPYLLLLLDTNIPSLISYALRKALTHNRPRRVPRSFNN